jgi:hypothetical protein
MKAKRTKKCFVGFLCGILALFFSSLVMLDERIASATTQFFLGIGINPREEALVCIGIWAVSTFVVGYILGVVTLEILKGKK